MVRYSLHACLKEIVAVCSSDILHSGPLHYKSTRLNYKCNASPVPKHHALRVLQGKGNKLNIFLNSELSKCDLLTSRFGLSTHWIASITLRPLCSRGKIPWYQMDSGFILRPFHPKTEIPWYPDRLKASHYGCFTSAVKRRPLR